jgi:nucleolar protein 4
METQPQKDKKQVKVKTETKDGEKPTKENSMKELKGRGIFDNKPGRLIVRNLQYDIKQKHLQKTFAKYGNVIDTNVPLNPENSLNKGFGFVEFKTKEDAKKAIDAMNAKNYKGRMISVDYAMSKTKYNKKIEEIIEKNPIKNKRKLKEVSKSNEVEEEEVDSWASDYEDKKDQNPKEKAKPQPKTDKKAEAKSDDKKEKNTNSKFDKQNGKNKEPRDRSKPQDDVGEGQTLFVRNIDYSVTEADLRDFFGEFGEVLFAKLVKSRENQDVHKGSAFVKFSAPRPVEELARVSDQYWSTDKRQKTKAQLNDLESQLEFRGRRLVMFKAESKKSREQTKVKENIKEDKRNTDNLKIGLVTTKDFVHTGVSDRDMEDRVRLFKEKQASVKKNPNLFVSKNRMCVRNLDKRMNEKTLSEFCASFTADWKETLGQKELREANKTKLVHQFKILKDQSKVDADGKPKSNGIGFIEAADPNLAIYLVNNMNNFIMNKKLERGLIVDFALEDHRKLLKRKQRMESNQKKLKDAREDTADGKPEKKKREFKEKRDPKDPKVIQEKKDKLTIDQIEDITKLKELQKATNSRGKRMRIKKRIALLNGEVAAPEQPQKVSHLHLIVNISALESSQNKR